MQKIEYIKSLDYRPDIDGLRAVSVFAVIGFHAFPNIFNAGFIGVDIFFVISGYLISTIIFQKMELSNFSFLDFYARRIRRIFPSLILILSVCFIFGWFALFPNEFQQLNRHIAGSAGFVSNFILWNEAGYFDNESSTKPLLHIWSLGIEEQFYIFWPLLIWIFYKTRFNFIFLILSLLIISFSLNILSSLNDKVGTFYSPLTRFWELLVGSFLAWITINKKNISFSNFYSNIYSVLGVVLIIISFLFINEQIVYPGFYALLPVFGAFLIIFAGPNALINKVIFSNKIFVWFGLISFPLYLWHWPFISFARIIESEFPNENFRIVAIIISIILSWLTYKYLEKPIRFKNKSFIKTVILIFLMCFIFIISYFSYYNKGLPNRGYISNFNEENFKMAFLFSEDDQDSHKKCMDYYQLQDYIRYCNLSDIDNPKIALIGDSHARALYDGLSFTLKEKGHGLLNLGGRLFLDVMTYPKGDKKEIDVYKGGIKATKFVLNEPSIKTVIMVSRAHYLTDEKWVFRLLSNPTIEDRKKVWEIGMRKTLDEANKNKKKVIFLIDNPNLNFDPKKCISGRPLSRNKSVKENCSILKSKYEKENEIYLKLVNLILNDYPEVKKFDTTKYLCDDLNCFGMKNGKILYRDQDHLSFEGGRILSKELIKLIDF